MTNRLIDPAKPDDNQPELATPEAKTPAPEGDLRIRRKNNPAWGHALRMAETEEQWRELINHLPDNARQIWRALNDMKQFWGGCCASLAGNAKEPLQTDAADFTILPIYSDRYAHRTSSFRCF